MAFLVVVLALVFLSLAVLSGRGVDTREEHNNWNRI